LAAPSGDIQDLIEPIPGDEILSVEIESMGLEEQIEVMVARWASLEGRINQLNQRLASLERERLPVDDSPIEDERPARELLPVDTPQNRRTALIAAGVPDLQADEIVWRQSELAMQRLELQDQAIREGWFRSERYYEELRATNGEDLDLRAEIGDESYDRYLYQTGEMNRVRISSVIQGSTGEGAGLQPGDIIETYGSQRILEFSDLRNATTSGARDELVPVTVRRGDTTFDTWMARGPIGVSLEAATAPPDA
jgi:hypothetical protein